MICGWCSAHAGKALNPIQFGLLDAKTAVERYDVLYKTHREAKKTNAPVSYKGIQTIDLEIPLGAKRIPLTDHTDFAGVSIYVTNNTAKAYLFELAQGKKSIEVTNAQVDEGDFTSINELRRGRFLVIVEDSLPWVKQRIGYKYGAIRKDILLVEDGKAENRVVSPYNNSWSKAKAYYCPISHEKKEIKNLKLFRQPGNKDLAFFVTISNQNNVVLSDIEIHTPQDTLLNDAAIAITNCTNIKFYHITIDGTYSRKDHSGYGVTMNNVWNSSFYKFRGHGNWGVFGNNNVNYATFNSCDINRFDIHCYGRDIHFMKCVFRNLYNQFSSVFGEVTFANCEFCNFIPVSFESSYNAYTRFQLKVNNCIITDVGKKNFFIKAGDINNKNSNERPELSRKEWPDIFIDNLTIKSNDATVYHLSNFDSDDIKNVRGLFPLRIKINKILYEKQ